MLLGREGAVGTGKIAIGLPLANGGRQYFAEVCLSLSILQHNINKVPILKFICDLVVLAVPHAIYLFCVIESKTTGVC